MNKLHSFFVQVRHLKTGETIPAKVISNSPYSFFKGNLRYSGNDIITIYHADGECFTEFSLSQIVKIEYSPYSADKTPNIFIK